MANRYFPNQRVNSFTRELVLIHGKVSIVQEVKAAKTTQGVTLTAVAYGTSGNSITIAFTSGGTAGSEVVTVSGSAISVQIQSGTSTITQVRTAINASTAAAALVVATGTSSSTVATAAAVSLTGGIDGVASTSINGATCAQTGVGEYTVTLADAYPALISAHVQLEASTAVDLVPQIKSTDVSSAKTIVFRLLTGGTATDPSAACTAHFSAFLRNSSVVM